MAHVSKFMTLFSHMIISSPLPHNHTALLSSSKRKEPVLLATKPEKSVNRCLIPYKIAGTDLQ